MPPQLLFDISGLNFERVVYNQQAIRQINPQRGDMEQLNGIVHMDLEKGEAVGFKDIGRDEFWVAGHIPGRPLFPGVLMVEASAQLAGFVTHYLCGWEGFIGFGGVDSFKFRLPVEPGVRLYILAKKVAVRHRRMSCAVQGLVNGNMVFEGQIIGTQF